MNAGITNAQEEVCTLRQRDLQNFTVHTFNYLDPLLPSNDLENLRRLILKSYSYIHSADRIWDTYMWKEANVSRGSTQDFKNQYCTQVPISTLSKTFLKGYFSIFKFDVNTAVADLETSERGPRNMIYNPPCLAALFLAYCLDWKPGGHGPLGLPRSATDTCTYLSYLKVHCYYV